MPPLVGNMNRGSRVVGKSGCENTEVPRTLVWHGCGDATYSFGLVQREVKYNPRVLIGEFVILVIQFLTAIDIHMYFL